MKTASLAGTSFSVKNREGGDVHLAMQELWVTGHVLAAGARLVVRHVFRSAEEKPVEVVYAFVLPRDAALRRFRVEGEGFKIISELRPAEEAQRLYEKGIEQGHLAALAKEYGDGLVNLSVGNLKPDELVTVHLELLAGVAARDDGFRFRFPFTLAPTYHPKARMIEVGPGVGEQELPEDKFGDLLLPPFHKDAAGLHRVGFDLTVQAPASSEVASPSHPLRVGPHGEGGIRVSLATEGDVPNRDLVIEVTAQGAGATVLSSRDTNGKGQFAAVIPSTVFGKRQAAARRVVFVLDRSGSMGGSPIEQAKKAIQACVAVLSPEDSFSIVAFDNEVEVLGQGLLMGDAENRRSAAAFLDQIGARGGTELSAAMDEGSKVLGGADGDLFVVTDGQVTATENIIAKAKALGVRVHVLGIGSAAQDRFLTLLARETGGISRYLTARERVDTAAVDLFASAGSPVARKLSVEGKGLGRLAIEPDLPANVFAGSPLVLLGETEEAGEGVLLLRWDEPVAGSTEIVMRVPEKPTDIAETLFLLRGSRLTADAQACCPGAEDTHAATRKEQTRFDKRIRDLSLKYRLASRQMSLVAVVERQGDAAGQVPKTQVVPVGMPQDTPFGAYFGHGRIAMSALHMRASASPACYRVAECSEPSSATGRVSGRKFGTTSPQPAGTDDLLVEMASRLEPDGGMPGGSDEDRFLASLLALLFFAENGHTPNDGAFRVHVRRLIEYVEDSGQMQALRDIRGAAHDCGRRLEDLDDRIRSSAGGAVLGVLAEASGRCRRSVAELVDRVEGQNRMIEGLLSKIRRGERTTRDHAPMVRDLIAKGRVQGEVLRREMEAFA